MIATAGCSDSNLNCLLKEFAGYNKTIFRFDESYTKLSVKITVTMAA